MPGSVILGGARTPIGKLSGALAGFSAMDLGGLAIAAALERSGVAADQVDYVFMGQVLQAGQGQITARQAAVKGGISMSVPATTINKVCLSGLNSIFLADLLIQAGAADVVVAGGMESMTKAPYLLPGARAGYRLGDGELVDSMMYDGLYCQFDHCAMGLGTERYNEAAGITREAQDNFAALSPRAGRRRHQGGPLRRRDRARLGASSARATPSWSTPTRGCVRGRRPSRSARSSRPSTRRARSRPGTPARSPTGAPPSSSRPGPRPTLWASPRWARSSATGRWPGPTPLCSSSRPTPSARRWTRRARRIGDVDLFEINEAFAVVGLASMADLGISDEITNVNGGAIALGHPIGMSGTRLALTLLHELKRRGGGLGAASLCGGGGQGDALLRPHARLKPGGLGRRRRRGPSTGPMTPRVLSMCRRRMMEDDDAAGAASPPPPRPSASGRRESHDASGFYDRFTAPVLSADDTVVRSPIEEKPILGDARHMDEVEDASVALVVTSPPYFAGKEYEEALGEGHVPASYFEYLEMLTAVFAESVRTLEPGGRIAVNVANLGRKPYRSLSADVIGILQDELGLLLRGEVIWLKAAGPAGRAPGDRSRARPTRCCAT